MTNIHKYDAQNHLSDSVLGNTFTMYHTMFLQTLVVQYTYSKKKPQQITHLSWSLYCYEISEDLLSLCHKSVVFQCPILLAGNPKLEVFIAVLAAQEVTEQRQTT